MQQPLLLSIIIPTCARNASLMQCLDLLAPGKQKLGKEAYEVIVTDDGPAFDAVNQLQASYPWVKFIKGPQKGPAANRNNGVRLAAGEWLVFTDDDCLPDVGWLQAYADAIVQYPGCKAFEGAIFPDDWELLKKDLAECPVNTKGGCFWSANIIVEKKSFETIKGFDEQFALAAQEDMDIKNRLLNETKILFVRDAFVIHPVRIISFRKKMANIPAYWENWMKYILKQKPNERKALVKKSIVNHCVSIYRNVLKLRVKSTILHLFSILQYLRVPFLHLNVNNVKK